MKGKEEVDVQTKVASLFTPMILRAGVYPAAIFMCAVSLLAAEGHPKWQTIEVGNVGNVTVRLKVLSPATLADAEWMMLEFFNSGRPVRVKSAHYRIESERYGLADSKPVRSGSLASGNDYDLFPDAWKTTPVGEVLIPRYCYRVVEQLSRYSSALLALAPPDGLLVKASIFLDLELENGSRLQLPDAGVPFQFEWRYPDEEGFARMRKRLVELLKKPESEAHKCHGYILETLLGISAVSKDIPFEELLTAIDRRSGGFDGRECLVKHLDTVGSRRREVVDYYLVRLQKLDIRVCDDLARVPAFWDESFIEPLVTMHEQEKKAPPFRALHVLSMHSDDWKDRQDIPKRLSAVLLNRFGHILKLKPEDFAAARKDELSLAAWAGFADDLGRTRDTGVLPLLRPFLDCRTQVLDPKTCFSALPGEMPPAFRACDCALDAILLLLDGNVNKAYSAAGFREKIAAARVKNRASTGGRDFGTWFGVSVEQIAEWRDEMILTLKKRFDDIK
jgi:hypothetical protein